MGSDLQIAVVESARRFDTFVMLIQGAQPSGVGRFLWGSCRLMTDQPRPQPFEEMDGWTQRRLIGTR